MTTAEFQESPDDPYGPLGFLDFSTSSPDTLQRLDATRKADNPALLSGSQLGLSTSPNGSYHEYSDDSAESSKRSPKRDADTPNGNSPSDMTMDTTFESSLDYDTFLSEDAPFIPNSGTDSPHDGLYGGFGFPDRQTMSLDQDSIGNPASSVAALKSPEMPTITPSEGLPQSHHRQDSV